MRSSSHPSASNAVPALGRAIAAVLWSGLLLVSLFGCAQTNGPVEEPAEVTSEAGEKPGATAGQSGETPPTTDTAPSSSDQNNGNDPMTKDECKAASGTFVASIGGHVECPEGKQKLGAVRFGIEGGVCCK